MDTDAIIAKLQLANYKDQVVNKLEADIKSVNLEDILETTEALKSRLGGIKRSEDTLSLKHLIERLEKH